MEQFYEFQHKHGEVPIDGAGNGIFISGNNHSDDLFMGYVKKLDGFATAAHYHVSVSFKLATDVGSGMIGVGGSPGENVSVKCGVTSMQPRAVLQGGDFRLNLDKGNQGVGGADMVIVGNMAKDEEIRPGEYEFKKLQSEFDVTASDLGEIYLIIGTDSGFEATTSYYLDDVSVTWEKIAGQPVVTPPDLPEQPKDPVTPGKIRENFEKLNSGISVGWDGDKFALSWEKVGSAESYEIFAVRCGEKLDRSSRVKP